jgi:hypothetical protein
MQITINGTIGQGPSWGALDKVLASMLGDGRLTRIARRDGACNYRHSSGVYDLTFVPDVGDATDIVLNVNA